MEIMPHPDLSHCSIRQIFVEPRFVQGAGSQEGCTPGGVPLAVGEQSPLSWGVGRTGQGGGGPGASWWGCLLFHVFLCLTVN